MPLASGFFCYFVLKVPLQPLKPYQISSLSGKGQKYIRFKLEQYLRWVSILISASAPKPKFFFVFLVFFCNFFLVFYFFIFFRGLGCRFGYLRVGNRSGGQAEPFSTPQGSDLPLSNLPVMSCRLSHPLHMVPCILSSNVASIGDSLLDNQGASSN